MSDEIIIKPLKGIDVVYDKESIEPEEFFTIIKHTANIINEEDLNAQLNYLNQKASKAKLIGQKKLLDRMEFFARTTLKEKAALSIGVSHFVSRKAILDFSKKVKPHNVIKIIELERYPRLVPDDVIDEVSRVMSFDIFDDYVVVFTDLTDNKYQSKSEQKFIERNRDPIIFGIFKQEDGDTHERMYHIADWADEHCDLTFDKMLDKIDAKEYGFIKGGISKMSEVFDIQEAKEPIAFFNKMKKKWRKIKDG